MKEPPSTVVDTAKPKRLIIDVRRQHVKLVEISEELSYDPTLRELSRIAREVDRDIERGVAKAIRTGRQVVVCWRKRQRYLAELMVNPPMLAYAGSYTATPAKPSTSRSRGPRCRTVSLPRTRSREMSHAPRSSSRSTPKAAQRSGDSGDSSDPPGPEQVALAAFLLYLLRGVDS